MVNKETKPEKCKMLNRERQIKLTDQPNYLRLGVVIFLHNSKISCHVYLVKLTCTII